jgi:hypothetical protein
MSTNPLAQPDQNIPGLPPASAERLCAWLNSLEDMGTGMPGHADAKPVYVRIGRTIYPSGARYTDRVGETVMYLLGPLPASYSRRVLYRIQGDDRIWYLSGYYPPRGGDPNDPRYAEYHPFGRHIMLRRSGVPTKIDYRDPRGAAEHNWLVLGDRGGRREIMAITVIPLDAAAACEFVDGRPENGTVESCGLPNCWDHGTQRPPIVCPLRRSEAERGSLLSQDHDLFGNPKPEPKTKIVLDPRNQEHPLSRVPVDSDEPCDYALDGTCTCGEHVQPDDTLARTSNGFKVVIP